MEEEIDELRAKVIASMPSSTNPNFSNPNPKPDESPKSKEDGEISSGDDAPRGLATCSIVQPNTTTLSEHFQSGALSNHPQHIKPVKPPLVSSSSTVNVQPRISVSRNYNKHLKRKKIPFNSLSPNLSWHARGSDDNLVISFSDDESRSSSEESTPKKSVNRKDNTARQNNEVPSSSMQIQSGRLQGWPNRTKTVRKKESANPAPFPSRGANFRHSVPSAEKHTITPRHYPVIKMSGRQEHGLVRGADAANHTVESLRNEIALRENKLKVHSKSTPQSYVRNAGPYSNNRGSHGMKPEIEVANTKRSESITAIGLATNVASIRRPVSFTAIRQTDSVGSIGLAPNEQVTKRLKLDEHFNNKPSTVPSDISAHEYSRQAMQNNDSGTERDMGCLKGGSDTGTSAPASCEVSLKEAEDDEGLIPASETMSAPLGYFEVQTEQERYKMLVADVSGSSDKSDKRDMAVDPAAIVDQKSYLSQMATNVHDEAPRQSDMSPPTILRAESVRHSIMSRQIDVPNLFPSKVPCEHSIERSQQIITSCGAREPLETSNHTSDKRSVELPGGKLCNNETMGLLNYSSPINISGEANMNLQSLVELEELQDKELEEAQELRRRCELEERNALKAYRKAQRALVEANERCSLLYRKRELFSAQLRALLMDVSSSLCPSSWQSHQGTVSEALKDVPDSSFNLLPSLGHHLPSGQTLDQLGYESNTGCADGPRNTSLKPMNRQELLSGQCSEHDASSSDHRDYGALDGVHTPAHDPNISVDDKFPFDTLVESRLECDVRDEHCGQRRNGLNAETERLTSVENAQNYELLEASLRSKLVARLHRRMPSKSNEVSSTGHRIQRGSEKNSNIKSALLLDQQTQERDKAYIDKPGDGGFNIRSAESGEMTPIDSDLAIDPFLPFCMFELRGKCNNEECCFQHLKSCTIRNLKHNEHSNNSCSGVFHLPTDSQSSQSLAVGKKYYTVGSPHALSHHMPTYYIGSNLIKVDPNLSQSILARSVWQYWQSGFCASFSVPFSVHRILPAEAPFIQTGNYPVGDDYNWNRLSLYYETLDGRMKQFVQALPEPEQSLEMALSLFDVNVYKPQRKKALSLLSRAIEADPTCVVLWVVYLHIYYAQERSIGKDDMFFHAVQHNEGSYELWLLYINSRMQLSDRLEAYEYALTTFCHKENPFDKERRYTSACILDIFLQMIDFLCMSGDVEKAIRRVSELLETSGDTLLLNIHSCLIVSDRCIFWFCCIYLAVYRKLPKLVVQQFEFEKDLPFGVEWPSANLTIQRKDNALDLMKLAVNMLDIDVNPQEDPAALRSLQFLAVSHIKCVTALEGSHRSADLLANYLKLYPTCIELVLISSRLHENLNGDAMFRDFEESLSNWPKGTPGSQCLWNQYAKHTLAYGKTDIAENLMTRWYKCFCEEKEGCDCLEDRKGSSSYCFDSLTNSAGGISCLKKDDIFGLLNLSIKRLLEKDVGEARLATDKALKLASPEDYKHTVREHAACMFTNGFNCQINASFGAVLDLLNCYMADIRATPFLEPLSRKFYRNIKKPRVRHFINNMLGPVSRDFTLMNSVLEVCYGPSLLPGRLDDLRSFVDFVESLMEITPANYYLALSVYRITSTDFQDARVSAKAIRFWASSLLINSIFQAVPVAPENVWLEAAAYLTRDSEIFDISLRFHQQAISVYPFSIKLWQSFLFLSKKMGDADKIVENARVRGIQLSQVPD
ncbi:uncharacterized protein M6B38_184545 [Iris pallida]|uniref:Putative zinc-finger domain-containing protein n=1 Tax=Iris pallida TaxID=29817 RepID=A0AAX6EL23_IRIPA|nr:uncharacterized protein M6B38_184545 [Iris pallida]